MESVSRLLELTVTVDLGPRSYDIQVVSGSSTRVRLVRSACARSDVGGAVVSIGDCDYRFSSGIA